MVIKSTNLKEVRHNQWSTAQKKRMVVMEDDSVAVMMIAIVKEENDYEGEIERKKDGEERRIF